MSLSSRPKVASKVSSQRLPPPSLFQGPPSHNASSNSLHLGLLSGTQASAVAAPGAVQRPAFNRARSSRPSVGSSDGNRSLSPFLTRAQSQGEADSAEVLWQEMQNTLAEVELSATRGEHVCGEEHSKALDELRTRQLKLAQAWARSEVDEVVEDQDELKETDAKDGKSGSTPEKAATTDSAATYRALEAETEKDLQHARKRREANDRYFDRINNGVLDVVAGLEEVAEAMRAVERESKDIWSDTASESVNTTVTSTHG